MQEVKATPKKSMNSQIVDFFFESRLCCFKYTKLDSIRHGEFDGEISST